MSKPYAEYTGPYSMDNCPWGFELPKVGPTCVRYSAPQLVGGLQKRGPEYRPQIVQLVLQGPTKRPLAIHGNSHLPAAHGKSHLLRACRFRGICSYPCSCIPRHRSRHTRSWGLHLPRRDASSNKGQARMTQFGQKARLPKTTGHYNPKKLILG